TPPTLAPRPAPPRNRAPGPRASAPAARGRAPGPRALALAAVLALGAGRCLPDDERPPPGVVTVWLEGAEGLGAGAPVVTDDGWSITFERVLVASSGVEDREEEGADEDGLFASDDGGPLCAYYYETEMRAIYDVAAPGRWLLGHFGGLGECGFDVEWGRLGLSPDVLGPGVSIDEVRRIVAGVAAAGGRGVPALYVAGVATKGDRRKSFAWPFSPRSIFGACGRGRDALTFRRQLDAGSAHDALVTVHPEWLFADAVDPAKARLRFGPVADADDRGDGDGDVARAELEDFALSVLAGGDGTYAWPDDVPQPIDPVSGPRKPSHFDFINLQAGHVLHHDGRDPCAGPAPAE
ncbi:MAG TPA: hypothetical protein VFS43_36665, partial [Polyangiaceae bacterium]|nr:hypothetical protein [Polyangiaceae bacterium]